MRKTLPCLLSGPQRLPSSSTTIAWWMSPDVTVSGPGGDDELLAEGIDEVLLLSRALAAASITARRAGSLLDLAIGTTSTSGGRGADGGGQVECELLIDPDNPLSVMVLWRTRIPSILSAAASRFGNNHPSRTDDRPSSTSYTEFKGKSTVTLSRASGLVTNIRLNEVKINDVAFVDTLGTALAAVRKAARSALATPSIGDGVADGGKRGSGNLLLDGILNGIQDVVDAVDALPSSEERDVNLDSKMYVLPAEFWDSASFPIEAGLAINRPAWNTDNESTKKNSTFIPEPIDQYRAIYGRPPVAGSMAFVEYAMMHRAMRNFATYGLYTMAGKFPTDSEETVNYAVSSESIRSLFTTDAELVTFGSAAESVEGRDCITLLRGAGKLADLYRSLALFQETSGGDWKIISLVADVERRQLLVSWRTESPLQIEGSDSFVFEAPTLSSPYRLPLSSDGDTVEVARRCSSYFDDRIDDLPLRIRRIENRQLVIAGLAVDSTWAQTFISSALRSGLADNAPLPDATIIELLRSLTQKKASNNNTSESPFPSFDDAAAISFYGILRALHRDIPNIASADTSATPAGEFLADTVELRGLLDEVLVRGDKNYRRLFGIATSSLRAGIQTNTVRLAAKPQTTVEVTSKGSVKVNLILALWVAPQLPLGGAVGQSQAGNQGFGAPLKIEVSSEYIIDSEGKIFEHKILESRLNGVLTPGDLFSRWIKGLAREEKGRSKVALSPLDSLMDAITWVISMQERKNEI
ncbi:hypothetical protein ACHAXA_011157 [Cyclostephanos tholiformis]|uniref:Uncharacterized protein n=1 Tax=Cyclostephanos tholiformis TaxID=382380 RepID=A0ABD3SFF1_9STRA